MDVVPLRIVNVSVPSSTVPAELVTVAFNDTFWAASLNDAVALAAAVAVAAALIVKTWLLSVEPPKSTVPL